MPAVGNALHGVPRGVYDVDLNRGHVTQGTSRDITQFTIDSLLE